MLNRWVRTVGSSLIVALSLTSSSRSDAAPFTKPAGHGINGDPAAVARQPGAPALAKPVPLSAKHLPDVFSDPVPVSLDDLKTFEQHIRKLVELVSPAVVAVSVGGAAGSGVVISDEGAVLTAAHVCDRPNREVRIVFPDGRTVQGVTLGTDHETDAGLMRITDPGPWPHVSVGDFQSLRIGNWVLGMGHPGGFDPERPRVARLGRVISLDDAGLRTDCTLSGGDSGGPLFDMQGGVIGIHSRISGSTAENYHVPLKAYTRSWDRLVGSESWGDTSFPRRSTIGASGVDDPAGCRMEVVNESGPAFQAGLRVGDIVRKMNGREVEGIDSFRRYLAETRPGEEMRLDIQRDGREMTLNVLVDVRRRRP